MRGATGLVWGVCSRTALHAGHPLPSRQVSRGASGAWPQAPLSSLPSWVAPPQGSGSPPGTLLLQLLVDRVSGVWLTWGLQDSVCGAGSSQVLEAVFLEGGSGVSTGFPWSPGLRGAARAAFLRDPGEVVFLEGGVGIQPSGEREDVGCWAWGEAQSSVWLCCRGTVSIVSWLSITRACLLGPGDATSMDEAVAQAVLHRAQESTG